MTYKDVLSDLTNLLDRHKMIQTWGYGNLSDLVTPFKKEDKTGNGTTVYDIDYPYAFLQPLQHSLQKGKVTYNFNLIMMEQCQNESQPIIDAQSNCQQYIQDVLAEIYYNFEEKYDFTLNSSLTPFKEKYDDTVSGMTANISIEIPMILNDCIAPFDPKPVIGPEVLLTSSTSNQLFRPDLEQSPLFFQNTILDTFLGMRTPPADANYYSIEVPGVWTFTLKGQARAANYGGGNPGIWPNGPDLVTGNPRLDLEADITNWPVVDPGTATFDYEMSWTVTLSPTDNYVAFRFTDEPPLEKELFMLGGTTLTATVVQS